MFRSRCRRRSSESTERDLARPSWADRAARALTEVLAPSVIVTLLPLVVARAVSWSRVRVGDHTTAQVAAGAAVGAAVGGGSFAVLV